MDTHLETNDTVYKTCFHTKAMVMLACRDIARPCIFIFEIAIHGAYTNTFYKSDFLLHFYCMRALTITLFLYCCFATLEGQSQSSINQIDLATPNLKEDL
jgi:hypothetical protein